MSIGCQSLFITLLIFIGVFLPEHVAEGSVVARNIFSVFFVFMALVQLIWLKLQFQLIGVILAASGIALIAANYSLGWYETFFLGNVMLSASISLLLGDSPATFLSEQSSATRNLLAVGVMIVMLILAQYVYRNYRLEAWSFLIWCGFALLYSAEELYTNYRSSKSIQEVS